MRYSTFFILLRFAREPPGIYARMRRIMLSRRPAGGAKEKKHETAIYSELQHSFTRQRIMLVYFPTITAITHECNREIGDITVSSNKFFHAENIRQICG